MLALRRNDLTLCLVFQIRNEQQIEALNYSRSLLIIAAMSKSITKQYVLHVSPYKIKKNAVKRTRATYISVVLTCGRLLRELSRTVREA